MQAETPPLPGYLITQAWAQYPGRLLQLALRLPKLFAKEAEDGIEEHPDEKAQEHKPEANNNGRYEGEVNIASRHMDATSGPGVSTISKVGQQEGSAVKAAADKSKVGLKLPSLMTDKITRLGPKPIPFRSAGKHSFDLLKQNRGTEGPKQLYFRHTAAASQEALSLKRITVMTAAADPGINRRGSVTLQNTSSQGDRFDSSIEMPNAASRRLAPLQWPSIYPLPLATKTALSIYPALGPIANGVTEARNQKKIAMQGARTSRGSSKAYMPDENDESGMSIAKEAAPVSINLNRPLLETLIVQNSSTIDAEEIRQRVEDVLLDVINSAVSKL